MKSQIRAPCGTLRRSFPELVDSPRRAHLQRSELSCCTALAKLAYIQRCTSGPAVLSMFQAAALWQVWISLVRPRIFLVPSIRGLLAHPRTTNPPSDHKPSDQVSSPYLILQLLLKISHCMAVVMPTKKTKVSCRYCRSQSPKEGNQHASHWSRGPISLSWMAQVVQGPVTSDLPSSLRYEHQDFRLPVQAARGKSSAGSRVVQAWPDGKIYISMMHACCLWFQGIQNPDAKRSELLPVSSACKIGQSHLIKVLQVFLGTRTN